MPEGHSIRRLALAFDELFVGKICVVTSPQGRFLAGAGLLTGMEMIGAHSHGKHLFLSFGSSKTSSAELWLHVHLGLYGAWTFYGHRKISSNRNIVSSIGAPRSIEPDEAIKIWWAENQEDESETWEPPHPKGAVRVRISASDCIADLTGPNTCEVISAEEKEQIEARLGPDPLGTVPHSRQRFVDKVRSSRRPIGELVMDQSVLAGVGNIYRAEGLFRQGISPFRQGNRVSEKRLKLLWDDFVLLLGEGVITGRIVTVSDEITQGNKHTLASDIGDADLQGVDVEDSQQETEIFVGDEEAKHWYVYHRQGRPCLRCGATVSEKLVQNRRLFWCPSCQR